jgi:hypothetical protein
MGGTLRGPHPLRLYPIEMTFMTSLTLLAIPDDRPVSGASDVVRGFSYLAADGTRITAKSERAQIQAITPCRMGRLDITSGSLTVCLLYRTGRPRALAVIAIWNGPRWAENKFSTAGFRRRLPAIRLGAPRSGAGVERGVRYRRRCGND